MQSLGIFSHFGFEPKVFSPRSLYFGSQVEAALCLEAGEKGGDPAKFLRPSGLTGSAGPEQSSGFLNGSLYWHVS